MRRLTEDECAAWIRANCYGESDGHHRYPLEMPGFAVDFSQPTMSRAIAVLAGKIADECTKGETLVRIGEWGVWPTEESHCWFERAMAGYGDPRSLREAPGFCYAPGERDDLAALVRWILISGWSGEVLRAAGAFAFFLTDDDWCGCFGPSEDEVREWVHGVVSDCPDVQVLGGGQVGGG